MLVAHFHTYQDTMSYKKRTLDIGIHKNAVPTLMIHGTKDIGVPYTNFLVLKSNWTPNGIKNSFVTFDGRSICGMVAN